jgi:16S rRNA (cytidine1402-2'-O)-methyltransferase
LNEMIAGTLYLVSTPIGNLNDISFRAIEILKSVSFIASEDTRKSSILLKKYQINAKMIPYHNYNQKKMTPRIINSLKKGETVALISEAGTPGILDPAYHLVKTRIRENIRIIPVPGACAFISALVTSGLPCNRFIFEGFLPQKKGRQKRINQIKDEEHTLVFYESPHRIKKTVNELLHSLGDRECVMAREITKIYEEFFRGTLNSLAEHLQKSKIKGEIVLIIKGKN